MRTAHGLFLVAAALFVMLGPPPRAAAEGTTAVPFYHLYRWAPCFQHFFTANAQEKQTAVGHGWKDGGVACYIGPAPLPGLVPLYRLTHPTTGDHYYTADPMSRDAFLKRRGYADTGIAGYVGPPGTNPPGTIPWYMFTDDYNQQHFYNSGTNVATNYIYVMEAGRVWPSPAALAQITLTSPKPGDFLTAGTTHTIAWTTSGAGGFVSLSLSTTGGLTWGPVTVLPVGNTGTLAWQVPTSYTTHARMKAAWVDKALGAPTAWATSATPGDFTILGLSSPPPSPPKLTAAAGSGPKVNLSWTPSGSTGVTGYSVERKTNVGLFGIIQVVGKTVTAFQDTSVSPKTTYHYRIRAWIGGKPSDPSNEVTVTTPKG